MMQTIYERKTTIELNDEDAGLFLSFMRYKDVWKDIFSVPPSSCQVLLNFNAQGEMKSAVVPRIIKC